MRIERAARRWRGPSLTPLIDVVFILLVFFMLVTTFSDRGALDVSVSDRGGSGGTAGPPPVTVRVEAGGFRWNGDVRLATAGTVVERVRRDRATDRIGTVRIDAADGVTLQRTVSLVEAMRAAGIDDIRWLRRDGG